MVGCGHYPLRLARPFGLSGLWFVLRAPLPLEIPIELPIGSGSVGPGPGWARSYSPRVSVSDEGSKPTPYRTFHRTSYRVVGAWPRRDMAIAPAAHLQIPYNIRETYSVPTVFVATTISRRRNSIRQVTISASFATCCATGRWDDAACWGVGGENRVRMGSRPSLDALRRTI